MVTQGPTRGGGGMSLYRTPMWCCALSPEKRGGLSLPVTNWREKWALRRNHVQDFCLVGWP